MDISLTFQLEKVVREKVASGLYNSPAKWSVKLSGSLTTTTEFSRSSLSGFAMTSRRDSTAGRLLLSTSKKSKLKRER
jgi:hypothetical protein